MRHESVKMRAFHFVIGMLASALVGACAGAGVTPTPNRAGAGAATHATPGAEPSPVQAPRPGILGCVESRELKAYVLALDAHRREARGSALAALGATLEERRGEFGAAGSAALGQSYEAHGQRFAVAAELAPHFEPRTTLAKQGAVLRRIDEQPRAHAVDVLVCGLDRCKQSASGQRVAARPLVVELAPGESWGGPLELAYDYWWARVRHDHRETCGG
jgi:hypothetical protein